MKTAIKLVFATLMLTMAATATDRTKGAFVQNATEGYYEFYGSYSYLYLDATVYANRSGGKEAFLVLYVQDWATARYLVAYGSVPISSFTVGPTTFVVKIPDLRASLVPNGYFDANGFPDPIVVNYTMTTTSLWRQDENGSYTQRVPQPDGTVAMTKNMERYTLLSVELQGEVAGYSLPLSDPQWGYSDAFLQRGNYKSHFVP